MGMRQIKTTLRRLTEQVRAKPKIERFDILEIGLRPMKYPEDDKPAARILENTDSEPQNGVFKEIDDSL